MSHARGSKSVLEKYYAPAIMLAEIFLASLLVLLLVESYMRVHMPALQRPSILISALAAWTTDWAYFLGQQFARLTDVWYFAYYMATTPLAIMWSILICLVIGVILFHKKIKSAIEKMQNPLHVLDTITEKDVVFITCMVMVAIAYIIGSMHDWK